MIIRYLDPWGMWACSVRCKLMGVPWRALRAHVPIYVGSKYL